CIIDAGSSGSRIYLYRWPNEAEADDDHRLRGGGGGGKKSTLAKVEQQAVFSDERAVGISNKEEHGIDLLDELLSSTKAALPPNVDPGDVPIYLGATAGMRLLNSESEADAIMAQIRSMLHASGFLFRDDWARTISGDEESVYGWLVANYLRNDGSFPDDSMSYGALDLGGASTQISLLSSPSSPAVALTEQFSLRIGNHLQYPVYTQSYLHYGADQARLRYDDKFASPSKVSPCYAEGYTNPDTGVVGSSKWEECFENVAKLFDKQQHSNLKGGGGEEEEDNTLVITPVVSGDDDIQQQRFIAMSVFVFVWDFLGLQIGTDTDDLITLKEKAGQICNLTHEQQTTQYDLEMKDKQPRRKTNKPFAQCFNAAFSYHLLSKGYGFPVSRTPVEVYYEINGGKVQWPLGLMLVEANKLHGVKNMGSVGEILDSTYGSMRNITGSYMFMVLILLSLMLGGFIRSGTVAVRLRGKGVSFQK
ncbi:hypothetical protein ACHAXR_008031, partial [Thalassiosira sp. AJA248-18]